MSNNALSSYSLIPLGHTTDDPRLVLDMLAAPSLDKLPMKALQEPTRLERLRWKTELLDFAASGHPLELYLDIAWEPYCLVNRLR